MEPHRWQPARFCRLARACAWPGLAVLLAIVPFLPGLTSRRVFYVRDLSAFFWGRYLWARHEWLAGQWPLWDPHVGGGQAAYADGLHQMFLPPAILVRLLGGEVLGFNLWVAVPFPLAALGAWLLFARRFSGAAAALGAVAFAACGPIVSTGNMPNLSWSVAALPWVLWATDRLLARPSPRAVAVLALLVACQGLAGEPVTFATTLVVALAYAVALGARGPTRGWRAVASDLATTIAGVTIGVALAAIQLIPMISAANLSGRSTSVATDAWSLRPTALLETVWLHLFGNFVDAPSLKEVPWMPLLFTGREPLLFSLYFGVPLLALGICGLAGPGPRRWRLFWVGVGFVSLVFAFGSYTPLYPLLRDYVPPFGSFRFPVKYIVVAALAVAAGAAGAWDAVWTPKGRKGGTDTRRLRRARALAVGFAAGLGALVAGVAAACWLLPATMTSGFDLFARTLGDQSGLAAPLMVRTVTSGALAVAGVSWLSAGLLAVAMAEDRHRRGRVAALCLAPLVAVDLLVHAWGINPVTDAANVAAPAWLAYTREPLPANERFYLGGKLGGTLDGTDFDASRGFSGASGQTMSAGRAALSIKAAFYPSGWGAQELLSYDLPLLWPQPFAAVVARFARASREERDRFLDRTGVRFRVLPQRRAGTRTPLVAIPQFYESFLFDWGGAVAPRVAVLADARMVADGKGQLESLFEQRAVRAGRTVVIDRSLDLSGIPRTPEVPFASIRSSTPRTTIVDAGAAVGGGYLILLDSFSDDWRATVDGRPVPVARADALFRAVRVAAGRHDVTFRFFPRILVLGAMVSCAALALLGLLATGRAALAR